MERRGWFATLFGLAACWLAGGGKLDAQTTRPIQWPHHHCPNCGRVVTQVYRQFNDGTGRHYHRCGRTLWFH